MNGLKVGVYSEKIKKKIVLLNYKEHNTYLVHTVKNRISKK